MAFVKLLDKKAVNKKAAMISIENFHGLFIKLTHSLFLKY